MCGTLPRPPRWATVRDMANGNVARVLGAMAAIDERGGRVTLGDLWRDGPAVVIFVRHFG